MAYAGVRQFYQNSHTPGVSYRLFREYIFAGSGIFDRRRSCFESAFFHSQRGWKYRATLRVIVWYLFKRIDDPRFERVVLTDQLWIIGPKFEGKARVSSLQNGTIRKCAQKFLKIRCRTFVVLACHLDGGRRRTSSGRHLLLGLSQRVAVGSDGYRSEKPGDRW